MSKSSQIQINGLRISTTTIREADAMAIREDRSRHSMLRRLIEAGLDVYRSRERSEEKPDQAKV